MPAEEELSGIGAAYMAGLSAGLYCMEELFEKREWNICQPEMEEEVRIQKYAGWRKAVDKVLTEGADRVEYTHER